MTIDRTSAHRTLVTEHNTLSYESELARVSLRKDAGAFRVTLKDKYYSKTTKRDYATLNGAVCAAEMFTGAYL